jgi:uncharacterized membrane protein YgdD (TMEM256/DUF423 family)
MCDLIEEDSVERTFLILSGINGFLAVALGAFGAHGLRSWLATADDGPRRLEVWQTASSYHLTHALALGLAAYVCSRSQLSAASLSGYFLQAGIVLFSGSLYALTLTGIKTFGAITPLGGLCFLAGWASLLWAAWKL